MEVIWIINVLLILWIINVLVICNLNLTDKHVIIYDTPSTNISGIEAYILIMIIKIISISDDSVLVISQMNKYL